MLSTKLLIFAGVAHVIAIENGKGKTPVNMFASLIFR
jgi:hypothetical protein